MFVANHGNDRILVFTANNDCIQHLDNNTIQMEGEAGGQPTSIAFHNCLFVVDRHGDNPRVSRLRLSGGQIRQYDDQLNNPKGIAIHPRTHRVYVADTDNHSIRILNNDLTVNVNQPPFGTEGDGEQQFMEPHDISFVEDGNIVTMCVADHGNNRIQVFTANNDIIQYTMTIRTRGGGGVAQRTSIAVR